MNAIRRGSSRGWSRPAWIGLASTAALALALASCAPTTRGDSARSPLRYSGQTLAMEAGQTLYLEQEFGYSEFGYRPGDFGGSFWVPRSARAESADVAREFAVRDANLPGGWTLELSSVRAVRETADPTGPRFGAARRDTAADRADGRNYHVEVVYALSAPPEATRGRYRPRFSLTSRRGDQRQIEFDVRLGG